MASPLPLLSLLLLLLTATTTLAEIHSTSVRSDARPTIPFHDFGFTHSGFVDLNVSQISLSNPDPTLKPDPSLLGFFLSTNDSWVYVLEQLRHGDINCSLQSKHIIPIFTFDQINGHDRFNASVGVTDSDLFTLYFANCVPDLKISMNVLSAMYNLDPGSNRRDYLSVGKTNLPFIYFRFFVIYTIVTCTWIYILYKKSLFVYRFHFFMLAVIALKALNLLCETEYKSYIKRTGNAHGWDVLFCIFGFLNGVTFFTLIALIGTGLSFLKPSLQWREKGVLMSVIPLQVVVNVAQVTMYEASPFGRDLFTWLWDVICCMMVLFPFAWSPENLDEAAGKDENPAPIDGKAALTMEKLRQYFGVVFSYFFFTRAVVYALDSYPYQWTRVVATELATLAFYVFTGYHFRPKADNPYSVIHDDEEEEAGIEMSQA